MEVGEEVVLAARILEVEAINHEVGTIYPLDVLHLLRHCLALLCCWRILSACCAEVVRCDICWQIAN